jgi:hypothetical protein
VDTVGVAIGTPVSAERAVAILDPSVALSIPMVDVAAALPESVSGYDTSEVTVAEPVSRRRSPFLRSLLQPVTSTEAVTCETSTLKEVAMLVLTCSVETPVQGYESKVNVSETLNSFTTLTVQSPSQASCAAVSRAVVAGALLTSVIPTVTVCTSAGGVGGGVVGGAGGGVGGIVGGVGGGPESVVFVSFSLAERYLLANETSFAKSW